jgi:hypothetical protein
MEKIIFRGVSESAPFIMAVEYFKLRRHELG